MSGYLNRLAASVARQKPSVHPFVQPVYGARERHEEAPGFVIETESTTASHAMPGQVAQSAPFEPSSTPGRQAQTASLEPPSVSSQQAQPNVSSVTSVTVDRRETQPGSHAARPAATPKTEHREELVESSPVTREVFQPLLSPSAVPLRQPETSPSEREPVATRGEKMIPSAATPETPSGDASTPREWAYQPIVADAMKSVPLTAENPRAADSGARETSVAQPLASPRQVASAALSRRAPAAPQPQDIQIHIGRIEVIAVPPPAPRPAPAPVRKGLTLDEYLSGNNGRTR